MGEKKQSLLISFGVYLLGEWYGTRATTSKKAISNVLYRVLIKPAKIAGQDGRAAAAQVKLEMHAEEGSVIRGKFYSAEPRGSAAA